MEAPELNVPSLPPASPQAMALVERGAPRACLHQPVMEDMPPDVKLSACREGRTEDPDRRLGVRPQHMLIP